MKKGKGRPPAPHPPPLPSVTRLTFTKDTFNRKLQFLSRDVELAVQANWLVLLNKGISLNDLIEFEVLGNTLVTLMTLLVTYFIRLRIASVSYSFLRS